jgi:hypothetical protein
VRHATTTVRACKAATALFTDFSYSAIGVPRNPSIPANRDTGHYDLGICSRPDHALPANRAYCGMFKTPTLRNVATRAVFFHNGQIKSLEGGHPLLQHAGHRARAVVSDSATVWCGNSTICRRATAATSTSRARSTAVPAAVRRP